MAVGGKIVETGILAWSGLGCVVVAGGDETGILAWSGLGSVVVVGEEIGTGILAWSGLGCVVVAGGSKRFHNRPRRTPGWSHSDGATIWKKWTLKQN